MAKTNVMGCKWMTDAFANLIDQDCGRVVNIGSETGTMWIVKQDFSTQSRWSSKQMSWEEFESAFEVRMQQPFDGQMDGKFDAFNFTKFAQHKYTQIAAKQYS